MQTGTNLLQAAAIILTCNNTRDFLKLVDVLSQHDRVISRLRIISHEG